MYQDGVHAFKRLDAQQLAAIRQLADLCNEYDHIILKLNWEMLQHRKDDAIIAFLSYAGGQVVGFLGLYQFQSSEAEASGMVHPQYRRKGIFGKLVRAAQEECVRRNMGKLIFICERNSASGRAYAKSAGARYSFSEYWMQLGGWTEAAHSGTPDAGIALREAQASDIEILTRLSADGFGMDEADARDYVQASFQTRSDTAYIAELRQENGEALPIGKIHVMLEEGEAFIFGFCISSQHRKQGYGRRVLQHMLHLIREQHEAAGAALEVAVENENALGLYTSCGFRIRNANDYYNLDLPAGKPRTE